MKMPSKDPAAEHSLAPGTVVMYENDQQPLFGVTLDFRKGKYLLLNERGREAELAGMRLHRVSASLPDEGTTTAARTIALQRFRAEAEALRGRFDIQELWRLTSEEPREYAPAELLELCPVSPEGAAYAALRLQLLADRIYFKREKNGFLPRPVEIVADLTRAEEVRRERLELEALTIAFLQQALHRPGIEVPPRIAPMVLALKEFALEVHGLEPARQKEAKEMIARFTEATGIETRGRLEERAFEVLLRTGLMTRNTNVALIRHRIPVEFSAAELAAAESCVAAPRAAREDHTALRVLTIDDRSTRDMDDALSLERRGEGFRLGIHISDVAAAIAPGSALDRCARARATSLYSPERVVNMLPPLLSEDRLSLVRDRERPAVSCFIDLDRSFALRGFEFKLTTIKVAQRFTYEEADRLLESGDGELNQFYEIAGHFQSERLSAGALSIHKNDATILVDDQFNLTLVEIDEDGPARSLIGEMMVLSNSLMARFARDRNIPFVYRSQEPAGPGGPDLRAIPEGPAREYAERSQLKKSTMSTTPAPHATLGLPVYTQATSPIRRFLDLCNQRQLVRELEKLSPVYTPSDLEEIIEEVEKPLSLVQLAARESKRFWMLRYLEESKPRDGIVSGTVIRTDLKFPIAELDGSYMTVPIRTKRSHRPGERVRLKIAMIVPKDDYIRLEVTD